MRSVPSATWWSRVQGTECGVRGIGLTGSSCGAAPRAGPEPPVCFQPPGGSPGSDGSPGTLQKINGPILQAKQGFSAIQVGASSYYFCSIRKMPPHLPTPANSAPNASGPCGPIRQKRGGRLGQAARSQVRSRKSRTTASSTATESATGAVNRSSSASRKANDGRPARAFQAHPPTFTRPRANWSLESAHSARESSC